VLQGAIFGGCNQAKTGLLVLAFPPGSEILDIGAGSDRDLDILIREEYEAFGAEPSLPLRDLATANIPRLAGRIYAGGSLETGRLFSYDGRNRRMLVSGEIWRELCLSSSA
jgi:hypothetical protein